MMNSTRDPSATWMFLGFAPAAVMVMLLVLGCGVGAGVVLLSPQAATAANNPSRQIGAQRRAGDIASFYRQKISSEGSEVREAARE